MYCSPEHLGETADVLDVAFNENLRKSKRSIPQRVMIRPKPSIQGPQLP